MLILLGTAFSTPQSQLINLGNVSYVIHIKGVGVYFFSKTSFYYVQDRPPTHTGAASDVAKVKIKFESCKKIRQNAHNFYGVYVHIFFFGLLYACKIDTKMDFYGCKRNYYHVFMNSPM